MAGIPAELARLMDDLRSTDRGIVKTAAGAILLWIARHLGTATPLTHQYLRENYIPTLATLLQYSGDSCIMLKACNCLIHVIGGNDPKAFGFEDDFHFGDDLHVYGSKPKPPPRPRDASTEQAIIDTGVLPFLVDCFFSQRQELHVVGKSFICDLPPGSLIAQHLASQGDLFERTIEWLQPSQSCVQKARRATDMLAVMCQACEGTSNPEAYAKFIPYLSQLMNGNDWPGPLFCFIQLTRHCPTLIPAIMEQRIAPRLVRPLVRSQDVQRSFGSFNICRSIIKHGRDEDMGELLDAGVLQGFRSMLDWNESYPEEVGARRAAVQVSLLQIINRSNDRNGFLDKVLDSNIIPWIVEIAVRGDQFSGSHDRPEYDEPTQSEVEEEQEERQLLQLMCLAVGRVPPAELAQPVSPSDDRPCGYYEEAYEVASAGDDDPDIYDPVKYQYGVPPKSRARAQDILIAVMNHANDDQKQKAFELGFVRALLNMSRKAKTPERQCRALRALDELLTFGLSRRLGRRGHTHPYIQALDDNNAEDVLETLCDRGTDDVANLAQALLDKFFEE